MIYKTTLVITNKTKSMYVTEEGFIRHIYYPYKQLNKLDINLRGRSFTHLSIDAELSFKELETVMKAITPVFVFSSGYYEDNK